MIYRLTAAGLACTLACSSQAVANGNNGRHTIVDTAVAAGQFKILTKALGAARLVETLQGNGPFTVFAPTDDAFAQLPKETLRALLLEENRDKLTAILTYHVVSGNVLAKDVAELRRASTVNGQAVGIEVDGRNIFIGGATVQKADIRCSNGVIHVIDRVLLPTSDDIVATAAKAGTFGTLLAAAKAAGLASALDGKGPFTVFAPTDEAFAKIPKSTLKSLLEPRNKSKLAAILKYHVVAGRVFADDAVRAGSAPTLQKKNVEIAIRDGRLRINDASVVANDIQASNGVIHVIDSVLMPPAPPKPRGEKLFGLRTERPSKALAYQLGIDRHSSLLVTTVTKGSEAETAGLRRYDVITHVANRDATPKSLERAKQNNDYGESVAFAVRRGSRKVTLNIRIGERARH